MQISSFNGGLNKRVSSYLMQSNEGVKYSNIDTTSGALAPLKDNKDLNANLKPSIAYFNEHWIDSDENRDYVKFQDKIFYSNGQTRPQWSPDGYNWFQLGIDKPKSDSLKVEVLKAGELNLKSLYGYFIGGDNNQCVKYPEEFKFGYQPPWKYYTPDVCGANTLLDFETGRLTSGSYSIGAYNKIEVLSNVDSAIYEDGGDFKFRGKVAISNIYRNTSSGFVPVMIREKTSPVYYVEQRESIYLTTGINRAGWYMRFNDSGEYIAYNIRRARTENEYAYVKSAAYISSERSNYSSFQPTKEFKLIKPSSEIKFVVYDSSDSIKQIYSSFIPEYVQTKFPNAGGISYFAGFSFEWLFDENDKVEIFADDYRVATKIKTDVTTGNRVYVASEAVRIEDSININEVLSKVTNIEYIITYVSSNIESLPSDTVNTGIFQSEESQSIPKVIIKASDDPQVSSIKLYRRGGSLTQFSLVKEFANTDTVFLDDLLDSQIDGAVLNSYYNDPAPKELRHLTLYNVMLFGSIADKLYYTNVASPYSWSPFNYIDFDDTITGIGGTSNGLLVFTRTSTYIVTGTSPDTFSKYLLSSGVGCVLHKSIQPLHNSLVWLSEDSVCSSNGGEIQNLSMSKLGALDIKTPRCSAILNDIYYLSHQDGTLITDFRFDLVFRESDKVYLGLSVKGNQLFGVEDSGKFVELHKGQTPLSIEYVSPKFSDGSISTLKTYKDIYFHSTGDLTAKVFIDDKIVGTKLLAKGFDELKVSSENTRGYSIQFEISGTGTLNEIEYKVESRQNGR